MKKFILSSVLVLCLITLAYAGNVTHTGFDLSIKTKTDTGTNGTETDTVVWTPASGARIVLMGYQFNSDTATILLVESGTTAVIPKTHCTASGIRVMNSSTPIWEGAADATLTYTVDTAGDHSILMWGYEK